MNDLALRESADRTSGAAINLILRTASIVGIDLPTILSPAGLTPVRPSGYRSSFPAVPSPAQLTTTFQALISVLSSQAPQRGVCDSPSKEDVDLFCSCLINCENLAAVIEKAIRFTKISNDRWGELGLCHADQKSIFLMDSRRSNSSASPAILDMFALSFFYKLFSWLIAEPLPLIRVLLHHKGCIDELGVGDIFNCPVVFDGEITGLVLDSAALKKPVMRTYRELLDVLASLPIALMPLPQATSVSAQIEMIFRRAMSAQMPIPNLETVAGLLNQSVSTLRRNLLREDTSFQAIMDHLRMQRAVELLSRTELTIDDIADLLGFSAPSVFSRAFKGWTGYPPSAYRLMLNSVPHVP